MRALRKFDGWRLPLAFILTLLAALVMAAPALAVEVRTEDRIVVGEDQVVGDDLYAFGNTVTVDGTVEGDLIAAGSTVTVNGTVEGDVIAAAQVVTINGAVEDDARVAGQALALGGDARVEDDLLSAGASLQTEPGATVGGDLFYGGQQALLAGDVDGNVRAGANALELAGRVGGDVNASLGGAGDNIVAPPVVTGSPVSIPDVEPGLTLTDDARIGGDLAYEAPRRADIASGATVAGSVGYERLTTGETVATTPPALAALYDGLRRLVALLLVGLLLVWAAPGLIRGLADTVRERPLPSLGFGLVAVAGFGVAVFVVLLATVLLAVVFGLLTLGGLAAVIASAGVLAVAALALAFAVSAGYLAQVVVSYAGGRLLLGFARPERTAGRVLPLALGLVLYLALTAIPIAGTIVALVVVLLGLGAISIRAYETFRAPPKAPPES